MSYGHRIEFIRSQTLALIVISGEMHEHEEGIRERALEAKKIACRMAEELSMPEALENWEVGTSSDTELLRRKFTIAVGKLAKACEAFDHLEAFPYRETLEENIRGILNL